MSSDLVESLYQQLDKASEALSAAEQRAAASYRAGWIAGQEEMRGRYAVAWLLPRTHTIDEWLKVLPISDPPEPEQHQAGVREG